MTETVKWQRRDSVPGRPSSTPRPLLLGHSAGRDRGPLASIDGEQFIVEFRQVFRDPREQVLVPGAALGAECALDDAPPKPADPR